MRLRMPLPRELRTAGERPILTAFEKSGVLTISDKSATSRVDACVVMSAFDDEPDAFALAVAKGLDDRDAVAVGVEAAALSTGVALQCRR